MKRLSTVFLMLTLLAGCGGSPEDKAALLFDEGVELASDYKFEQAAEKFEQLRAQDAQSPAGNFGTGLVREKQLQFYDALRSYMAIVEVAPSYAPAQAGCWRLLTHLEMYQDALDFALNYNESLHEEPVAKLIVAEAFMNVGVNRRAQAFLDTALDLGSEPRLVSALRARAFALDHMFDSAAAMCELAFEGDESADIAGEVALYLETIGLIDSAVAMSSRAVELSLHTKTAWRRHYDLALRNGYFFEARQAIKALQAEGTPELVIEMLNMHLYHALGDHTPARRTLTVTGRLSENNLTYRMNEMVVRGAIGDELTNTTNFDLLIGLMERQEPGSLFSEYLAYFAALQLAEIFTDRTGLKGLDMISRRLAGRSTVGIRKAYLLFRSGQHDEFKAAEQKIRKSFGRQADWTTKLADIFADRHMRRYDEAEEFYRKALEADLWYRPAMENLVKMFRWLDQPERAVAAFDDYPHFALHTPELALLRAVVLAEAGRVDEGTDLFLDNAGFLGGKLYWFKEMWQALIAADNQEGILRIAAWLGENSGENADALVLAALMLGDEGKFELAIELALRAVEAEPENLDAVAYHARSVYYLGEPEVAIGILETSIVVDRRHVASNYFLSRFLAMEGAEPQRAANLARRTVFDATSALKQWVNLSYVYFQLGDYGFSRGEALKASRSYKGTPEPLFRLGMALYMEGNEEAREKLQESIDLGLRGADLREAQQTLKKL